MAGWSLFPWYCSFLTYITKPIPTFSLPGQGTCKQNRLVWIQSFVENELGELLITAVLIK